MGGLYGVQSRDESGQRFAIRADQINGNRCTRLAAGRIRFKFRVLCNGSAGPMLVELASRALLLYLT